MGLLGVARANTAVGVSPETFLLLLLQRHLSASIVVDKFVHFHDATAQSLPDQFSHSHAAWLQIAASPVILDIICCTLSYGFLSRWIA
jgi:hypothetical protein